MGSQKILELFTFLASILVSTTIATVFQPRQGCESRCGNLSIPFPFGTSPNCYLDSSFLITCNSTYSDRPMPFLRESDIEVLDISLDDGHIRVSSPVAQDCYNQTGSLSGVEFPNATLSLPGFFISNMLNKFIAVGCDTVAIIGGENNYTAGCVSLCQDVHSVINGSCSGSGCCQTSIPEGLMNFTVAVTSLENHSEVLGFNPCGYAFVAEEKSFKFSSFELKGLGKRESFPLVLDWAIGNETCEEAQKNQSSYACQALNSGCNTSTSGHGYICSCPSGYHGNAYLIDGCQDIDECAVPNPCNHTCNNVPGGFSCSCSKGFEGDGFKNGTGCFKKVHSKRSILINVGLGISMSIVVLLVGSSWIYWILRKRKLMKLREQFFQQNGGIMLQQLLPKHGTPNIETAKIFTSEDLKKATNNYDESRVIGQGGFGTVYKGILPNNKVVAIKKSKVSDQSQIEQFINEVVVLSQINHRNVVKLLGCCLETEVPLLVYEFIANGTLSDHIHNESRVDSFSWETHLKIASETAGAISYLHSATSLPIIHRDIKSTNILLDDSYTAKVSDFGASRLVPLDHTQLTTLVQGTFGYLDPEYFHSSQLTDKSDVYSFGVLLAELLTGQKALSFDRLEKDRNLATYFISAMKEDRLLSILDGRVVNGLGNVEQLKEVAKLAKKCLRVKGEERPSMKEVAMELEGLRLMNKHKMVDSDLNPEEFENLLNHDILSDGYSGGVGSSNGESTTIGYDSMRSQIIVPYDGR